MTKVILLTTPGCVLCDFAKHKLERISKEMPIEITERNVLNEPELFQKYQPSLFPAIIIDGKLEFTGLPNESQLREKLSGIKNEVKK